jgi:hypothetical protein
MDMTWRTMAVAAAMSVACASEPIRSSQPNLPASATAGAAGVRVSASAVPTAGDSMRVWLSLENHSGRPLRVAYRDLHLQGSSGSRYAAVAPVKSKGPPASSFVSRDENVTIPDPPFEGDSAFVFIPTLAFDPWFHRAADLDWRQGGNTGKALPEGSLRNGGSLSGFVYFDGAAGDARGSTLVMELADADGGAALGQVRIALVNSD